MQVPAAGSKTLAPRLQALLLIDQPYFQDGFVNAWKDLCVEHGPFTLGSG
jgi:hypothetical protein